MASVQSSFISDVDYDESTQVLKIKLASNGSTYTYSDVPKNVYDNMMSSSSLGKYFSSYIKKNFVSSQG